MKLSQRRAGNIVLLLIEKFQVNQAQISAVGKGESEPLVSEKQIINTQDKKERTKLHSLNQRYELEVITIK